MIIPKAAKRIASIRLKQVEILETFAAYCEIPLIFLAKCKGGQYLCLFIDDSDFIYFLASPIVDETLQQLKLNQLTIRHAITNRVLLIQYSAKDVMKTWSVDILYVPEELLPDQGIFLYSGK